MTIPLLPPSSHPLIDSILLTPTPSPISPFLSLEATTHAGRSLFALSAIPASTLLHSSSSPFASTVLEGEKREVCWNCFKVVERGRWKVREFLEEGEKGDGEAIRWFCKESCRNQWREVVGEVGREAVRGGEKALARASKSGKSDRPNGVEALGEIVPSLDSEIEEGWTEAMVIGDEIVRRRIFAEGAGEPLWRQRGADALLSTDDPDVFRLLISGITSRYHASLLPLPSAWTSLSSLVPSLATNSRAQDSHIRMYLSLLSTLPVALLSFTTPNTILSILSRDNGNSFGIWSATHDDGSGDRGELLAYGIYPSSSFFNHSCRPNLVKRRNGQEFEFWTGEDGVRERDEACISYLGGGEVGGREVRRAKLMVGWGFWCECVRCREEKEEGDEGP
ncbi:hypothetical protein P7C70_g1622, partial [Phenoliferia sp. Uapishka_3]